MASEENSTLSKMTNAAGMAKGAVKTGKAIAGIAKGASAGPYGALAAGLWELRKPITKILMAVGALLLIPVLYISLLPSLIFGTDGIGSSSGDILNDNSKIVQNIESVETQIEAALRDKHDETIKNIEVVGCDLPVHHEYSITDDFSDRIIYESTLLISQYCASEDNYKNINTRRLISQIKSRATTLFTYSDNVTTREEKDGRGKKYTVYHHEYIVEYAGMDYFADNVFALSDKQKELAEAYAENLHTFLFDTVYNVEINEDLLPGETGVKAVDIALTKLGTPYSQPLRNEDGYFDCSSFTHYVYAQCGVDLSFEGADTAAAQGRYIAENNLAVSFDSLAPGDLVFYSFEVNHRYLNISHVGIYAGDGKIIDASLSKKKVVYDVIFIPEGKEQLMNQAMSAYKDEDSKRILIVEDTAQITLLSVPDTVCYCTVSETGEVTYYQIQGELT